MVVDKATYLKMAMRIEERYNIENLFTDGNKTYSYYKISKHHHVTKSQTCLVESWNCRLRHYLARLKRKTLCYSKKASRL
jgi:insertion element IS1 protein InsB